METPQPSNSYNSVYTHKTILILDSLCNLYKSWNLNPDRTVRLDRETLKPFTSTVHLRWRTIPCEKSMEPSRPQSDRPVLWTVTGSHDSNGLPCFSLKRRRFVPFFSFSFFFPNTASFGAFWLNNPETKPSGPSLSQSLSTSSSLSQSLSRLCLSLMLIAAQPSQLTLCLIVVAVVWYNNQFLSIYIFFYVVFWMYWIWLCLTLFGEC